MPKSEPPTRDGLMFSDVFTVEESMVLFEIMRAGGFATTASAVRCGLWKLAQHLNVECPPELFRLGPKKGSKP